MITILVVDDSQVMRNIVKNTFAEMNVPFTCLEAGDGKKALELLNANDISLVFIDWNMPGMDGIDFLKIVRAIPNYKKLPVVMVTSEKGRFSVVQALKSGATDYIVKPVQQKIFKEKVKEILVTMKM